MAKLPDAAFTRLLAIIKTPDFGEVPVGDEVALVDSEDLGGVSEVSWHLSKGYAAARIGGGVVLMHRMLLSAPDGQEVDHINGDKLDNRRRNLRFCTRQQNARNRHHVAGRSKFKGVRRDRGIWRAQIKVDGVTRHIGVFPTERLAAKAYDSEAHRLFGEFARTNADLGLF